MFGLLSYLGFMNNMVLVVSLSHARCLLTSEKMPRPLSSSPDRCSYLRRSAAMTYRLIISLRQFYERREQVTKMAQAENDVTKMLVAVVLMFMVCQILNPVRRILYAVQPISSQGCGSLQFYFRGVTSLGLAVDAASHFFVYSICNKQFVEKLSKKWRRLIGKSVVAPAIRQLGANPADDLSGSASRAKTMPTLPHAIRKDVQPSCSSANANTVV